MSSFQLQSFPKKIDLLLLHELDAQRYPFLLESTATGSQGRFDILFAFPQQNESLETYSKDSGFLEKLDSLFIENQSAEKTVEDLPFIGGWFIYLSYELAQEIEPVLSLPHNDGLVACLVRCPSAVIYDNQQNRTYLLSENAFKENIALIQHDIDKLDQEHKSTDRLLIKGIKEDDPGDYVKHLEKIHRYIVEGDVFQVNLSRLWAAELSGGVMPSDIYRSLRQANPAPFAGLMSWQGQSIVSSSPERLVSVCAGIADTRPIAGTRPRMRVDDEYDQQDDTASLNELIAHPKERAEHVMLIDLERNDLGRICVPGSIDVNELMCLESYAHVHHIVSNVRGKLRDHVTPGEVIRAVFPGGTITGCPKVRCMEIIAELEQAPRGPYTGSFGYLNRNGDMDLNILIRTIKVGDNTLEFRAGAGIVVDSDSQKEVEETRAKAKGMLKALDPVL